MSNGGTGQVQVCDPTLSPSECLTGTCQAAAAPHSSTYPLYTCR
jgi:hypothetical protein